MKQLRTDGSVDLPSTEVSLGRNKDGSLPSAHLKAIQWYMVNKGMKPSASNAWPIYHFKDQTGNEVTVHLADTIKEYEEFKRTNHGKRQSAA